MGRMTRQLHLNLFIHSRGHHEASWRHPASSPLALTDIRYYQDLAQRAEAGLFHSIFLADQLALGDDTDQYYQVAGPLNIPRCPQGRPVFVQAGSSDTGRRFAARHAEAVFTAHMEKTTAQAFYADLKALVAAEGRAPEQVLILPGLSPMIAS